MGPNSKAAIACAYHQGKVRHTAKTLAEIRSRRQKVRVSSIDRCIRAVNSGVKNTPRNGKAVLNITDNASANGGEKSRFHCSDTVRRKKLLAVANRHINTTVDRLLDTSSYAEVCAVLMRL